MLKKIISGTLLGLALASPRISLADVSLLNVSYDVTRELYKDFNSKFDVVVPSLSIEADAPVAVVDKYVSKHKTQQVAQAYLEYLYQPEGQELIAKHFFRPRNAAIVAKYSGRFPKIRLFTVDELFGGWQKAQQTHFADGGVFDQIYEGKKPGAGV